MAHLRMIIVLLAGCLISAASGAAEPPPCTVCPSQVTLDDEARQCLAARIDHYLEEAERTDPVLVILSQCQEEALVEMKTSAFPVVEPKEDAQARPATVFLLSRPQLDCLKQHAPDLAQAEQAAVQIDLEQCAVLQTP